MLGHSEVNGDRCSQVSPISILFLCLARNCAKTLPLFFAYLKHLEGHEFRCRVIIGESGSYDGTRELIEQAVGPRLELLDTTFMADAKSRLVRMAVGRQAILEAAEARGIAEDYICVCDLDNVMTKPPNPAVVRTAIERLRADKTLFAIGATSRPVYYDLLSLRIEGHDLSHLNAEIAVAKKRPFSYYRFYRQRIYSNQRLMTRFDPILCASSFNGFCIYNTHDYRLGSYRAPLEAEVCEHVSLNLSIGSITGKRMQIMPELTIQAPTDHFAHSFFHFLFYSIMKRLHRYRISR
jgi:hypothetical protein